ncbi:PilW family protein [Acinetobacter puyangensis]|uniref:PilW family protein n=1 Tax=Acinetobacter puyangensis TaxID=1096779 RepID=UPI003A4D64BA
MRKHYNYFKSKGFTLLELMVALALGLIISAAALQLFLTSQRSVTTQQALLNLQSDSLFGLEALTRDIRLANLNASQPYIDDSVLHGGIILTAKNYTSKRKASPNQTQADITLTEAETLSQGEQGLSNLSGQKSDQLVIQYRNILDSQFDCEGNGLAKDVYVVERYFLRQDTNRNDPNQPLALACKSTVYTSDTPTTIDLSGNGQIIIPRVDHFSIMLGVAQDGRNAACNADDTARKDGNMDCFGYITIENYKKLTVKPQIVAVKVGLLIRSTNTVGQNKYFNADTPYQVLQTDAKLIADDKNKLYVRNVVTQTIALRNGFGIEN